MSPCFNTSYCKPKLSSIIRTQTGFFSFCLGRGDFLTCDQKILKSAFCWTSCKVQCLRNFLKWNAVNLITHNDRCSRAVANLTPILCNCKYVYFSDSFVDQGYLILLLALLKPAHPGLGSFCVFLNALCKLGESLCTHTQKKKDPLFALLNLFIWRS